MQNRPPDIAGADNRTGIKTGLSPSSATVALALFLTSVVPSLAYMKGAGSMAAGLLGVSFAHIYLSLMTKVHRRPWPAAGLAVQIILLMLACISASSGVSLLLHDEVDTARLIGSDLFFAVFVAAAYVLARTAYLLPGPVIDAAVRIVFYILLASGIAGALHFSPFSSTATKAVVFFNEPSHYSLSFLPFLFYRIMTADFRAQIGLICIGFVLALLLESLTLIVGTTLICLVVLRTRHLLLFSPVVAVALIYLSLDYYADRLDFSDGSDNLSTLVFLSGWERAYLNLRETYGLGVGFQQFGIIGDQGRISDIIVMLIGNRLNVLDGGSVGAKFIGEFGLLGLIVLMTYLAVLLKNLLMLRKLAHAPAAQLEPQWVFFNACFTMFSIDLFVRGISYFSPSGLLFTASVLWLASTKMRFRMPEGDSLPFGQPLRQ